MPEKPPVPFDDDPEYVTTEFEETLPVQTYLIAFVVSNFDYTSNSTSNPKHRVFARPEAVRDNEAELALKYGQEVLAKFNEYLGVNYPLPKMDQFALSDFDAGAMENWVN
jgi:aminopeptidase N